MVTNTLLDARYPLPDELRKTNVSVSLSLAERQEIREIAVEAIGDNNLTAGIRYLLAFYRRMERERAR